MNKELIRNIIEEKFLNSKQIQDRDVIRAEYRPTGKKIGIYYFDFANDNVPYDLKNYQEKLLVNDYYNNPGNLQWNYYLVFLRDNVEEKTKARVEEDQIFSRKFLIKPDYLRQFLIYSKSEGKIQHDIVRIWRDKLSAVNLQGIFSERPVTEIRDNIIAGALGDDQEQQPVSEQFETQAPRISRINKLTITTNFIRQYPLPGDYFFGKVNLIKGSNGAGKTSMLEAIELVLCGKTKRNPEINEGANSIQALYNDDNIRDEYSPFNQSKYRMRNAYWYQDDSGRGKTYEAFNRYNFFFSDAAFDIQSSVSGSSLVDNLKNIAFGPEYTRVKARLSTLVNYLSPIRGSLLDEIAGYDATIREAESIIKRFGDPTLFSDLIATFQMAAIESKWLKPLPTSIRSNLAIHQKDISEAEVLISQITNLFPNISSVTVSEFMAEQIRIAELLEEINKRTIIESEIAQQRTIVELLEERLKVLQSSEKYFSSEGSFSVEGMNASIEQLENEVAKETDIYDSFIRIDFSILNEKKRTLNSLKDEIASDVFEKNKTLSETDSRLSVAKSSLNILENLASDIKLKGREFIALSPSSSECPLCESHFQTVGELASRINAAASILSENLEIAALESTILENKENLRRLELQQNCLSNLSALSIKLYSRDNTKEYSIEKIISDLSSVGSTLKSKRSLLEEKRNNRLALKNQGFEENELVQLKSRLEASFKDLKFLSTSFDEVKRLETTLEEQKNSVNVQILQLEVRLTDIDSKLTVEAKAQMISDYKLDKLSEKLRSDQAALKRSLNYFDRLGSYLEYDTFEELSSISLKIVNMSSLLQELKRNQEEAEQKRVALELMRSVAAKKEDAKIKLGNVVPILEMINDILNPKSEDEIFKSFLNANSNEIGEVFSLIHSPQEFTEVVFDEGLQLITTSNNNKPISQISSGQRSALALSVFIALNKKLIHGPDIILLDDPVVFTDDLNVLSFLDYLREMVIFDNRQIFFATASKKVAGLFEKKFSFLNEKEFKRIPLKRN
jgi:exonuclease SbcC